MTLEQRLIEAMAKEMYENRRQDHDGAQWELLRKDSWEVIQTRQDAMAAFRSAMTEFAAEGWRALPEDVHRLD